MNETKKPNEANQWKCSICGSAFKTIKERANCELICSSKLEEEMKKAVEAQKKEEQKNDKMAVDHAYEEFFKLRDAYVEKYGSYIYRSTTTKERETGWDDMMRYIFGGM